MLLLRGHFPRELLPLDLPALGLPLEGTREPNGEIHNLYHRWDRIPTDFHSFAWKVFDFPEGWAFDNEFRDPQGYIELRASPAYLAQGHNVFGSDDLASCALSLFTAFAEKFPDIFTLIPVENWYLIEVDINFSWRARDDRQAEMFMQAIKKLSRGHTRPGRGDWGTTSYFGSSKSKFGSLKCYMKGPEVERKAQEIARSKDSGVLSSVYTPELLEWAKGLLRWEAKLKSRWFERRGVPTLLVELVKVWDSRKFWVLKMRDVKAALSGGLAVSWSEQEIEERLKDRFATVRRLTLRDGTQKEYVSFTVANSVMRTYELISAKGFDQTKARMSRPTFDRHCRMLAEVGVSLAQLQSLGRGARVIPLVRCVEVFECEQVPVWAKVA